MSINRALNSFSSWTLSPFFFVNFFSLSSLFFFIFDAKPNALIAPKNYRSWYGNAWRHFFLGRWSSSMLVYGKCILVPVGGCAECRFKFVRWYSIIRETKKISQNFVPIPSHPEISPHFHSFPSPSKTKIFLKLLFLQNSF